MLAFENHILMTKELVIKTELILKIDKNLYCKD